MKRKRRKLEYIKADLENPDSINNKILRTAASPLEFPLKKEDKKDIKALIEKFIDNDQNEGLAATQFGIFKQIIVFGFEKGSYHNHGAPRTVWINPSYEKVNEKMSAESEVCYSVWGKVGPVRRHRRVNYKAYTPDGELIEGQAKGYMARVIQHEIDHLNGILFIDKVIEGKLFSLREWFFKHDKLGENDTDEDLYLRW